MKSGFVVLGSKNDPPPPYETKQSPKDKETNKHPDRGIKKNKKTRKLEGALGLQSQSLRLRKKKKVMHAGVLQVK